MMVSAPSISSITLRNDVIANESRRVIRPESIVHDRYIECTDFFISKRSRKKDFNVD